MTRFVSRRAAADVAPEVWRVSLIRDLMLTCADSLVFLGCFACGMSQARSDSGVSMAGGRRKGTREHDRPGAGGRLPLRRRFARGSCPPLARGRGHPIVATPLAHGVFVSAIDRAHFPLSKVSVCGDFSPEVIDLEE